MHYIYTRLDFCVLLLHVAFSYNNVYNSEVRFQKLSRSELQNERCNKVVRSGFCC
jgi:hypothetical protein